MRVSRGYKRNFNCQSESVVVIQTSQINLTFLVLGFFFLDNFVQEHGSKVYKRQISAGQVLENNKVEVEVEVVEVIASERRGSSCRNIKTPTS